MSLGEFFLPIVIVYLLTFIYWRSLWQGFAIIIILFLPIFIYFTIKRLKYSSREKDNKNNFSQNLKKIKSWKRTEVLKDLKFYSILPAMLASSFIITGIVINQTFIIESKGWEKFAIAKSIYGLFSSYSV